MLNKGLVLFTLITVLFAGQEAQAARPAMGSEACQGALPIDKLIRIVVFKKVDFSDCPRGARTPYLCALYREGLSHRSLGHAMRTTLADLGDGTCGRVNLRGVLIHDQVKGRTLRGDSFVDPIKALPTYDLRFGAWRTSVLYLAPVSGEKQLAACTSDLATCRNQVAKVAACKTGQLYDPATAKCVNPPAAPTAVADCAEPVQCPDCPECPTCTAKVEDARACVAARDTLQAQVNNLLPVTSKVAECRSKGWMYDPDKGECVDTVRMSPMLATTIAESTARAGAELDRLRAAIRQARSCLGRYHWNSDTNGWCDTSRR